MYEGSHEGAWRVILGIQLGSVPVSRFVPIGEIEQREKMLKSSCLAQKVLRFFQKIIYQILPGK